MATSKQDRTYARTASDIERKYNFGKSFGEVYGLIDEAKRIAKEAEDAVNNLDTELDQEELFCRLTNNWTSQGIYRDEDGNVYINADMLRAGMIKSKDGKSLVIDLDNGTADLTGNITTESVTEDGIKTYSQIRTDAIGTYKYNEDGELVARAAMLNGLLWLSNKTAGYVDFINASLRSSSEVDGLRIDEGLTVPNDLNTFEPTAYTSYAAPGQAEKLKVCGSPSSNYISGLTTPTGDSHAVNKAYADALFARLQEQIDKLKS